ncbi:MAG: transcriptional repressor [Alphaproteobacteria bacterium]|nr:transcriptional repressor [Alphaproteobacteria bacterium]
MAKPPASNQNGFPPARHDHARCVARALEQAEGICAKRSAQFTGLRRQVLGIIWNSHSPIGAYEILAALSSRERRPAPPTVYRALEFLQAHGLVHRIESKNAYIGCAHLETAQHAGQFLMCRACGQTAEACDKDLSRAIQKLAEKSGFSLEEQTVELSGLCPACKSKNRHAA